MLLLIQLASAWFSRCLLYHTISVSGVFHDFTVSELSDFGQTLWWKHVVCRNKRGSLLSVDQTKWCRARAPLVVRIKIFLFLLVYHQFSLTCYNTFVHDFFLHSTVYNVSRNHLTDYSQWKTNQKKCQMIAIAKLIRPSMHERNSFAPSNHQWKQKANAFYRRNTIPADMHMNKISQNNTFLRCPAHIVKKTT